MTITICVCGAGTMGSGIAQVSAVSGFRTILFDVNESALENAKTFIKKNFQYLADKEKISAYDNEKIFELLRHHLGKLEDQD